MTQPRKKLHDEKFCRDCGESIKTRAEICPKCGIRQEPPAINTSKNRITAALLAIFLGGIGAYKFYLGKPNQGVFYLLVCWSFIPGIIGLLEGLVFLCISDDEFLRRLST